MDEFEVGCNECNWQDFCHGDWLNTYPGDDLDLLAIKELTEICKNRPKSKDESKITFRACDCMYCKYSNTFGTICKKPINFYCYLDELKKKSNRDLVSEF